MAILVTAGDEPHAIPVSAALRAGSRIALIALAAGRGSLARLRRHDRAALAILAEGVAVTAYGRARVVQEELVAGVVAVELEVDGVQDHNRAEFEILSGVRWRWTDRAAAARDEQVREALGRLAERYRGQGRSSSSATGRRATSTEPPLSPPAAESS